MKTAKFVLEEVKKDPREFYHGVAEWLSQPNVTISFRGNPENVKIVQEALKRTKEFQEELNRPSATLESITRKLSNKHAAVESLISTIKISWPF